MKAFVKIKTLILLCKTVSEKSYPMRALQQDPKQPPPYEPSISPASKTFESSSAACLVLSRSISRAFN